MLDDGMEEAFVSWFLGIGREVAYVNSAYAEMVFVYWTG